MFTERSKEHTEGDHKLGFAQREGLRLGGSGMATHTDVAGRNCEIVAFKRGGSLDLAARTSFLPYSVQLWETGEHRSWVGGGVVSQ